MTARKSDALNELTSDLDKRHTVAVEILSHIESACAVYAKKDSAGVNIPRCSREHLEWLRKDLREYAADLATVRNRLPRLLSNEPEHLD